MAATRVIVVSIMFVEKTGYNYTQYFFNLREAIYDTSVTNGFYNFPDLLVCTTIVASSHQDQSVRDKHNQCQLATGLSNKPDATTAVQISLIARSSLSQ